MPQHVSCDYRAFAYSSYGNRPFLPGSGTSPAAAPTYGASAYGGQPGYSAPPAVFGYNASAQAANAPAFGAYEPRTFRFPLPQCGCFVRNRDTRNTQSDDSFGACTGTAAERARQAIACDGCGVFAIQRTACNAQHATRNKRSRARAAAAPATRNSGVSDRCALAAVPPMASSSEYHPEKGDV